MHRWSVLASTLTLVAVAAGCSQYRTVDSVAELRTAMQRRLAGGSADQLVVPFEIDDEIRRQLAAYRSRTRNERRQTEEILDFVFDEFGLRYVGAPTRNAVETFDSHEGNCLSFVNLFIGLARDIGLHPFYVEVEDYQRWSFEEGAVLSRGHIVAGMLLDGRLSTFDFLPYRPKAYRDLEPIDDLTAAAHYYNNLGAEALLRGEDGKAEDHLLLAHALAPDFAKAINNLGIVYLRRGETGRAVALLREGLEEHPEDVPLLTNLARALTRGGHSEEATAILDRLERIRQLSPSYYLFRAMEELAADDPRAALRQLREAQRLDPDLPALHLALAKVYLAMGDAEEGRRQLRRTLELDPADEEARRLSEELQH